MMGEGAHHMHHAKSDCSYARLSKVSEDVEERHPDIKRKSRGNRDVRLLEYTRALPDRLAHDAAPSMQFPWERTQKILRAKELLATDPSQAVSDIAVAVLDNALHCCTTADRELLRELHKNMNVRIPQQADHPTPFASWRETVLSERNAQVLSASAVAIREKLTITAKEVGCKLTALDSEDAIKEHYLEMFIALLDAVAPSEQQDAFLKHLSAKFSSSSQIVDRKAMFARLKSFLESPIPDNFSLVNKSSYFAANSKTRRSKTRQRVGELFFGPHSRL